MKELWFLLQTVLVPIIKEVRANIPEHSVSLWCFQGTKESIIAKHSDQLNNRISEDTFGVKHTRITAPCCFTSASLLDFKELLSIAQKFKILRPGIEHSDMEERLLKIYPKLNIA